MIIYGYHACVAALNNPKRNIHRVIINDKNILETLPSLERGKSKKIPVELVDKKAFAQRMGQDVVHQGIALDVDPLMTYDFDILDTDETNQIVVILDQIVDPQNIGAIMRSCAVFGVKAIIVADRSSPKETPALVKTASGAFERVPRIVTVNLVAGIKALQKLGFWTVGFSEEASKNLHEIDLKGKIALIMGNEGDGIRRLTEENCDFHVKLPTTDQFSTLNVSNATAVALYETYKVQNIG